jgi:hypothetical protein
VSSAPLVIFLRSCLQTAPWIGVVFAAFYSYSEHTPAFLFADAWVGSPRLEQKWIASQDRAIAIDATGIDDAVIQLSRSGCFGSCPSYAVTIHGSGRVEFSGDGYVCKRHPEPIQVDRESIARLVRGLEAVDFMSMPSFERGRGMDAPASKIIFGRRGSMHTVDHEYADRFAPPLLGLIEQQIDEVAQDSRWLPIRNADSMHCMLPDGSRHEVGFDDPGPYS